MVLNDIFIKEKRKVKSIQDNREIKWDNREKNAIEMLNELFLAADDPPIIDKVNISK